MAERWTLDRLEELLQVCAERTAVREAGHALAVWYQSKMRMVPDRWPIVEVAVRASFDVGTNSVEQVGYTGRKRLLWHDEAYREPPPWLPSIEGRFTAAERKRFLKLWDQHTLKWRIAEVTCIYAGAVAEAFHFDGKDHFDEGLWVGTLDEQEPDLKRLRHARTKLGRRWRLHMDRARERAIHIVRAHPQHIDGLASVLIQRGVVEGEEVEDMFDRFGAVPLNIVARVPHLRAKGEAGSDNPQARSRALTPRAPRRTST
jgi:hypothetical protein